MAYLIQDSNQNITRVEADKKTKRVTVPQGYTLLGLEWEVNPQKLDIASCVFDGKHLKIDVTKQTAANQFAAKAMTEKVLSDAMTFGRNMIVEFGAENMRMNITKLGMTNKVRKVLSEVMSALMAGSLYDAITEVKKIQASDKDGVFITDTRLLLFINKIEDYLQIPRSTHL